MTKVSLSIFIAKTINYVIHRGFYSLSQNPDKKRSHFMAPAKVVPMLTVVQKGDLSS